MADLNGFDATHVEPLVGLPPLPAGRYEATILASEMRRTRAGTGQYLEVTLRILSGAHQGRTLKSRLNLDNPNPAAVQIARAELSAICRAVGVLAPSDSTQLHDRPMLITVVCRNRRDTGEIGNEISAYHPFPKPPVTAPEPTPEPAAPKDRTHAAPWKKS